MAIFHVIAPGLFDTTSFNEAYQMSGVVGTDGHEYFTPAHNNTLDDDVIPAWPSAMDTMILQFWMRTSDVSTQEIIRAQELGSGVSHARYRIKSSGELEITNNTTVIGTSVNTFSVDTWYYIQIESFIDNSVGTHVVKVDGVEWLNITATDTQNGGVGVIDTLLFQTSAAVDFADMILADDSGTDFNSMSANELSILPLMPNAAGDDTDWTPSTGDNFETVNEDPLSETDYNESSTDTHKDTHNLDASAGVNTMICFIPFAVAEMTAADAASINGVAKHSTSEAAGPDELLVQNRLKMFQSFAYDNPSTSSAWSVSEVDAALAGYELSV